jgi:hypothetical protein
MTTHASFILSLKGYDSEIDLLFFRFSIGSFDNSESLCNFSFEFVEIFITKHQLRAVTDTGSRRLPSS